MHTSMSANLLWHKSFSQMFQLQFADFTQLNNNNLKNQHDITSQCVYTGPSWRSVSIQICVHCVRRWCNVKRLGALFWSHLSLFRWLVCLSVGCGMWRSSQLDIRRKMSECYWACLVMLLESIVGLSFINRHTVNLKFKPQVKAT